MRPLFKIDPARSRTVTLFDLILVALVTFVCVPALSFAVGYGTLFVTKASEPALLWWIAGVLASFGVTGIYAWMSAPVAIGLGWVASRRGWIGWAAAPCIGAFGGFVFGGLFWLIEPSPMTEAILIAIVPIAMLYATVGWCSLRWLRADIFLK